jgi:hypothetical protein
LPSLDLGTATEWLHVHLEFFCHKKVFNAPSCGI